MSSLRDIAALLTVAGNVLSKNAALRKIASENKWKTSSVLRDVGHERQERPSYDNFSTSEADGSVTSDPETTTKTQTTDNSVNTHTTANKQAAFTTPVEEEQGGAAGTTSRDAPRGKIDVSAKETPSEDPLSKAQDQDIFMLRSARTFGNSDTKQVHRNKANSFRTDSEAFRPTQADRYNIRAGPHELDLPTEPIEWKPQAAVETKLSEDTLQSVDINVSSTVPKPETLSSEASVSDTGSTSDYAPEVLLESATIDPAIAEVASELKDSHLSSSPVPSSRLSRLYHYGSLGASLGFNLFTDSAKRILTGPTPGSSGILSSKNTDLLVRKLSRMRGAALKLGQMISFQDENLPGPIREVLQRVQDAADYMPDWQLNQVMTKELGSDWRRLFADFQDFPIAAASIGQVHKATLPDGRLVAVKVQYPGVANSISSDLSNLSLLLTASRLLPKGLYLNKTIENARLELAWECDYVREAENTNKFRELVGDSDIFTVPAVIQECSGKQVLTTEFLDGVGIAKSQAYSQELRDFLGSEIMRLCLREVAEFHFMQTDPNWTNFLYNKATNRIELLDFGACRSFDSTFIDKYCNLLVAASRGDRPELQRLSTELGYLTGAESETMVNAHLSSILTLSEPFSQDNKEELYDFEKQTVTDRVKSFIPVMLRERLTPPPEETYSLHRRLSGHFLLCSRLKSRIPCKAIFRDVMTNAGYLT